MSDNVDALVDRVKNIVGRPTATAFVDPETEDRYFVLESLVVGASLFLLNRYMSGFCKPVEEAGGRHRSTVARILKGLFKGSVPKEAEEEGRQALQASLAEAKTLDSPERRAAAEEEVQRVLREYGESEAGASEKAAAITGAIFGS
jgi:hypothetical protein